MAEAQTNGFHDQPEGVAYPLPTEENGVGYPMPVDGVGKPFPMPVEGVGKPFPMPVEGEGRPFPLPVQDEGRTFPGPPINIPLAKQGEVKVTQYMTDSLDKVASAEGFKNYDVKIDHGSAIGDGFVGILFKATVREIDSDKQLTVVIKSPPESQARRHDFGAMELFKREVFVYSEMLPEFVRFQEERKLSKALGFFNFPKCYFAEFNEERDDAILIMEDLRETGYKMWDKFVPTNYEHTKLLVTALGKYHAVSFAMKEQQPEMFGKFQALDDFLSKKFTDPNFQMMMNNSIDQAANTLDPADVKRRNRVLMLKVGLGNMMEELVNPQLAEPFSIVNHGDCWSNNFMYHYRRGHPEKIVFLDWQISRYCSPVLDLVYFIFVCTDGPMRAKHYDELLNLYHRSLKDTLDHLGGDTMTQFPFTALLRQLKQFGKFGIIMATFLIPMLTTSNDELPDMDFMAENMANPDPAVMEEMMKNFGGKTNKAYESRMREALQDAIRYGYL